MSTDRDQAMRAAVEQSPAIVMITDPRGRVEYVNHKFSQVTGFAADEIIGKSAEVLGEQSPEEKAAMWAALSAGEEWRGEFHNRKKDGGRYWEQATISVIRGPGGEVTRFLKLAEDVTDRKRMELAVLDSESRLRRVVDANIVAIIKADVADGRILEANDRFLELVGYTREELEAGEVHWDRMTPPEQAHLDLAGIETLRQTGVCPPFEKEYLHKNGTRVAILIGAVMLEASERECVCFIVDITAHKRVEQELQRSNAELARFASVASHDLQAPLRSIAGFLQLLSMRYEGRLDPEADEFIRLAVDSAHQMHALIQDLLHYSRLGAERAQAVPVSAETALQQALDNLREAVLTTDAEVSSDPLPDVLAESSQLVQLFQNLAENALKFRGDDVPRVHFSARRVDGLACFSVADNGIGIDEDQRERIFELFARPHGFRYEGTGMGLAICRRIVDRFGGRIWAEAGPDGGAVFHFTLPSVT